MTEEQAFSRLKWRIENGWGKPQDVKAYNTIVEAYEARNKEITDNHHLFAKMLVVYIMQHAMRRPRPVHVLLREVEEIAQKTLIQHLEEFKKEVPLFKFELILHESTEGLNPIKDYGKLKRIRLENMRKNARALSDALRTDWSLEDAIKFIETQVPKFITTYGDQP